MSDQQALAIRDIHEKYLELQDLIPLQIACVQAMDALPSDTTGTAFRAYCIEFRRAIFGPIDVSRNDIGTLTTQPRSSTSSALPALPPNRSYEFTEALSKTSFR